MATVQRLSRRELEQGTLPMRLAHLLTLDIELGLAEAREVIVSALIALAVAFLSSVALIASVVVLLSAAFASIFGEAWEPFIIAGGGVLLLALVALGWSAWRLRRLEWPHETLTSIQERTGDGSQQS